MALFERPQIYAVTHVLLGFIGSQYPAILLLAVAYQLLQYFWNIRFFVFQGRIEKGNSLQHTGLKLFEIFIGVLLGIWFLGRKA
jgi:hypothetical protein